MLIFSSKMVGGLTRLSPLVSTKNIKIARGGGQFSHPVYFKYMTKEEIIARKNALRAIGHNIPVDGSWGPNLERLW